MEEDDEDENYADYELSTLELEMTGFEGATFYWKQGREYRHVGWLRVPSRDCRFWLYRDGQDTLLVVQQDDTCESCIEVVRNQMQHLGYELVDRRSRSAVGRDSCHGSESTGPPTIFQSDRGVVTNARALRLRSLPSAPGPAAIHHGRPARSVGQTRADGRTPSVAARAANVR
jgi:hypothetical protein